MKKRKTTTWCGLILFPLLMQAQEKTVISDRIGVECGTNGFFGETIIPEQVRASKFDGYYYYGYPYMNQTLNCVYGGIKYESFFFENQLGLAAGIRFSQYSSNLSPDWDQKYFAWRIRQDETTADYLTIENITQKNNYLGIPIELRYFVKKKRNRHNDRFCSFYFKLGTSVNYCVSSSNSVKFHDSAMAQYTETIEDQLKSPSSLNGWIYPG